MARFRYKMQSILDIKEKLETKAKQDFAQANQRLMEEEEKLDALKRRKEAYLEENSNREVRLELIENGAHGFARKNDKMAMEMVKEFLTATGLVHVL